MKINIKEIEDLVQDYKYISPMDISRFTQEEKDRLINCPKLGDRINEYAQILRERIGYSLNDLK